ncbi:Carnitine O-palmitoyltransferase 2, mitochondrial [Branchiostoma belcheri]|nr:Carnitine O-palmitoyltransferase 2, mitochondrial [Branchiostoma belcheri]
MAALQKIPAYPPGLIPAYRRLYGLVGGRIRKEQVLAAVPGTSVQGRFKSSRSREYLQESIVPSYHFQPSMPRLPVPKLADTCSRYLVSQGALLDIQQYTDTARITQEFQAKEGAELHKELVALNDQNKHTSYISGPWFDMYLKSRQSVVLNFNPFISFVDDPKAGYTNQLVRATNFVVSSARFMKCLRAELLKPEIFHLGERSKSKWFERVIRYVPSSLSWYGAYMANGYPLDMSQYKNLFNSTRIPRPDRDEIVVDNSANHLLVIRNGHMYVFDVMDADGNIKPAAELHAYLSHILSDQTPPPSHPLGYLTAENRDTWAGLRQKLEDCGNGEVLKTVDSAMFCLCLDDSAAEDVDSLTRLMLHGDGANRWYDKSFSLIVDRNGGAAVNFEHAWGDGVAVLRYFNEVFDDVSISPNVTPSCKPADIDASQHVRKLEFKLDGALQEGIQQAKENFWSHVKPLDLAALQYTKHGKNDLKKYKISPDSLMQLAIQMGYHRLTGKSAGTYESCSTAAFKHGRTETVRSCTPETRTCSLAFDKVDTANALELRQLIQACSDKHNSLTKNAAMGQGWDRHLFALRTLAEQSGASPAIFRDPAYAAINHIILSTSTLSSPAVHLGGFAPVVPDGFGIGYMIRDRELGYNVTSYPASHNVRDFLQCVESSLEDLFKVLHESSKAASQEKK